MPRLREEFPGMSTKHTPGKLTVSRPGNSWPTLVPLDDVLGLPVAKVDCSMWGKNRPFEEASANAERLALCWNEHDRLEAENKRLKEALEIDRSADAELKGLLAEENWRLRAQRDGLAVALKFYADSEKWKDIESGIGTSPGEAIDYGQAARDALAKVKGIELP